MLGGGATSWKDTVKYLTALKGLLKGEDVEWDGKMTRMLQNPGFTAGRPMNVPFVVAAQGPKGLEIARQHADGVIAAVAPHAGFAWSSVLIMGTVLPDDGKIDTARLMDAAGPGAAVAYHTAYDLNWNDGQGMGRSSRRFRMRRCGLRNWKRRRWKNGIWWRGPSTWWG